MLQLKGTILLSGKLFLNYLKKKQQINLLVNIILAINQRKHEKLYRKKILNNLNIKRLTLRLCESIMVQDSIA